MHHSKCFLLATSDMYFLTAIKWGKKVSFSVCAGATVSTVGFGQPYSHHKLFCSVPYGETIYKVSCSKKIKSIPLENEARHHLKIHKREDNFRLSMEKVCNFSLYCRGKTSNIQGCTCILRQTLMTQIIALILIMLT